MAAALAALDTSLILAALKDSDPRIREQALRLSEAEMKRPKPVADAVLLAAKDANPRVQFQAALTLGFLNDKRAFDALLDIAHVRSSDPWFRTAILSSVADVPSAFFQALVSKGSNWSDPVMLVELSALIGARQDRSELARWFGVLEKLPQPDAALTGLHRGLRLVGTKRLQVPQAEPVLARLLTTAAEPVQRAAWELSRYFELASLEKKAASEAVQETLPVPRRVLAIRALRGARFEAVEPVLRRVIESHPPAELESAAVDSLAAFDEPEAGRAILSHWRGYSPDARRHAVAALLMQRNRVPLLLKAVQDGQVEPSALDPAARSRLYESSDPEVVKRARALLESSNTDRARVVAGFAGVLNLKGDVNSGRKVFDDHCAKCHMPRRTAGRVGPDLSGINNKTKEELLTSILNPSFAIEPRFVNYVITTRDGRMYDGVIANETPGAITLRGGSEEGDQTVLRKNIAEIRASSVSLMPEGLEKDLTEKDLADVIAYLRGGL